MRKRAFLTPDDLNEDDLVCLRVTVPSHLSRYIRGALEPLGEVYRWEQVGAVTPDDAAEYFRGVSLGIEDGCEGGGTMIGQVVMWPSDVVPDGWLLCDGSALDFGQYPDLHAVIGTTYGSHRTGYLLPDFRGRYARHPNLYGSHPNRHGGTEVLGQTVGAKDHFIGVGELPPHNHDLVTLVDNVTFGGSGSGTVWKSPGSSAVGTDNTGDGDPLEINPASVTINFIIRAE